MDLHKSPSGLFDFSSREICKTVPTNILLICTYSPSGVCNKKLGGPAKYLATYNLRIRGKKIVSVSLWPPVTVVLAVVMCFNLRVLVLELEGSLGDVISSVKKKSVDRNYDRNCYLGGGDPLISATKLCDNAVAENRRSSAFNVKYRCSALGISRAIG